MPRPNTPVIPDGWSEHIRPTVNKTMTGNLELLRPSSTTTFDEVAGTSTYATPAVLWTGVGRVQRLSRRLGGEKSVGGRFVTEQMYQVSLPQGDVPEVQINDVVHVTRSGDDTDLNDVYLRVREVRGGTLIWSRDLVCEETTPTTR